MWMIKIVDISAYSCTSLARCILTSSIGLFHISA
jgi:hypothetical protein